METKSRAGLRVGGTMTVAAAGVVVLGYLGLPHEVAGAVVVLVGAGIRFGAQALGVAGLAGVVLLTGCGALGGTTPEQLSGGTCRIADTATRGALEYLETHESRDGLAEDRQAIRAAMDQAWTACQLADGLVPGEGADPEEARARLVRALASLVAEVPELREDEALMRQIVLLVQTIPEARDAFEPDETPTPEEDSR